MTTTQAETNQAITAFGIYTRLSSVCSGRTLALTLSLLLTWSSVAEGAVKCSRMPQSPCFVPLELGAPSQWLALDDQGKAALEQRLSHEMNEPGACRSGVVVLNIADWPLAFDQLSDEDRDTVGAALEGVSNVSGAYEAELSRVLLGMIEHYRQLNPAALISVEGLPIEALPGERVVRQVNSPYAAVIDELDLITISNCVSSTTVMNIELALHEAAPEAVRAAQGRPIMFPTTASWYIATGLPVVEDAADASVPMASSEAFAGIVPAGASSEGKIGSFKVVAPQSENVPPMLESSALAQFDNPPNPYIIGSGVNLKLIMLAGGPPVSKVTFRTWSFVAGAWQGKHNDNNAPFSYPHTKLSAVTPGSAEVQAVLRSANNSVLGIVSLPVIFQAQTPVAEFVNPPNPYVTNSGVNLSLQMFSGAPSQPKVTFKTYSYAANAFQATHEDVAAPFEYPASALNQVTPGAVEVQGIVCNSNDVVVAIIRLPMDVEVGSAPQGPVAQFVNAPNPYVIGQSSNVSLQMLSGAPANPNVVFQVWSNAAGTIQAPFVDASAPFSYPASSLDTVTPGDGEIQAIVRDANNSVVAIIKHPTVFEQLAPPPPPPPSGNAPTPVISAMSTSGMAPFTVHVHALNSGVGEGSELTARYEWNFGDSGSPFNTLVGWNAAHTYNNAGTYTITLKIISQTGQQSTATTQVTVAAPDRSSIYVSPSGSDSNNGTSPSSPIQTFAKAATMLANSRQILFQRGGTYNTTSDMYINHQNLIIGAYGSGNLPVIYFTSGAQYANMINFSGAAKDVIIENIKFDSPFAPDNLIVRGLAPHGTNITVRNCNFGKVSYAMNTGGGGVNGLFSQGNTTGVIGAYYLWGEGPNHVHIGNVVGGSTNEHNIRFGGSSRILIAHNDLTNNAKSTIWCMLGDHAYIGNNILREGRFLAGPNFAISSPSERFPWLVFENNQIINEGVILYSGAEDMMFRNNVITYHGGECFSIWGYISDMNRTVKNVTIANNTALNSSTQYGKFMKLGDGAENIVAANNLYCAPGLNASWGATNAHVTGTMLTTYGFHHNLWSNQASGSYVHSVAGAGKTVTQWAGYSQTGSENYRSFSGADLSSLYHPQFNANVGQAIAGVHQDIYGTARPLSGTITAGAVQMP